MEPHCIRNITIASKLKTWEREAVSRRLLLCLKMNSFRHTPVASLVNGDSFSPTSTSDQPVRKKIVPIAIPPASPPLGMALGAAGRGYRVPRQVEHRYRTQEAGSQCHGHSLTIKSNTSVLINITQHSYIAATFAPLSLLVALAFTTAGFKIVLDACADSVACRGLRPQCSCRWSVTAGADDDTVDLSFSEGAWFMDRIFGLRRWLRHTHGVGHLSVVAL